MKFIKEYKIFESKDDKSGIDNILDLLFSEDWSINTILHKGVVKVQINRKDCNRFQGVDIKNELYALRHVGSKHKFSILVYERDGMTYKEIKFSDLVNYYKNNILLVEMIMYYSGELNCSNPECDNILDTPGEKCKVCGELKI